MALGLAACTNGLGVPPETACRIETLLQSAASAAQRGVAENEAGDLSLADAAGEEATISGTQLHAALSAATDLSPETLTELDSVAINAQQIGIFLATRTQIEDEATALHQGLQGMVDVTKAWTERLQNAGMTCP